MNLFNEKLEARVKPGSGRGLFAVEPLSPGEIIAVWGGRITTVEEFHTLPEPVRKLSLQIEEDFFLVLQGGKTEPTTSITPVNRMQEWPARLSSPRCGSSPEEKRSAMTTR